jgi:hypothetical protein
MPRLSHDGRTGAARDGVHEQIYNRVRLYSALGYLSLRSSKVGCRSQPRRQRGCQRV